MIRSISYSRYLKIPTAMATDRAELAKNETISRMSRGGLELNPKIPASPATVTAAPLISHFSCCLRSPVARRQLSTCRATNDAQNTGKAAMRTTATAVSPGGLGCLISWPAPSTAATWRVIAHAAAPRKYAATRPASARYAHSTSRQRGGRRPSGNSKITSGSARNVPVHSPVASRATAGPNGRSP
jgi:hypothetical protein